MGPKDQEIIVNGIIAPVEWDDDATVIRVCLLTEGEEYLIDDSEIGMELVDFIDYEMEVGGTLTTAEDGSPMITAGRYSVLASPKGSDWIDQSEEFDYDNLSVDEDILSIDETQG